MGDEAGEGAPAVMDVRRLQGKNEGAGIMTKMRKGGDGGSGEAERSGQGKDTEPDGCEDAAYSCILQ